MESVTENVPEKLPSKPIDKHFGRKIQLGKIYFVQRSDGEQVRAQIVQDRTIGSKREYYVHYIGLNRRLDQWIDSSSIGSIDSDRSEVEQPNPNRTVLSEPEGGRNVKKLTRNQKRKHDEINHVERTYDEMDPIEAALERQHEAVTKVKYIDQLRIGRYEIDTWYYSPYPEEYRTVKTLYMCQYCLLYMRKLSTYRDHRERCQQRQPPGKEIYRKGTLALFEIDGCEHKIYCQTLCLLAKLFLDHKTLYYDVDPFLFYVLCEITQTGYHLVGYFSKEKRSPNGNNVACILVLPPHQRKGYGKLLIAFSYELSRREGVIGCPEKPLSDLGLCSYRSYWSYTLLQLLKNSPENVTIRDLSEATGITVDDCISTLQSLRMTKYVRGQHVLCVNGKMIDEQLSQFKRPKFEVDTDYLRWTPRIIANPKVVKKV